MAAIKDAQAPHPLWKTLCEVDEFIVHDKFTIRRTYEFVPPVPLIPRSIPCVGTVTGVVDDDGGLLSFSFPLLGQTGETNKFTDDVVTGGLVGVLRFIYKGFNLVSRTVKMFLHALTIVPASSKFV